MRPSQLVGLLLGALLAASPTFLGMFPFGREAPNGIAAALGLGLAASAAVQAALALAVILRLVTAVLRAALALSLAMTVYAVGVVIVTWATAGFGTDRDLRIAWTLGGPVLALAGTLLALASLSIGPNRGAVLLGDAALLFVLVWPVWPDGQPGIYGAAAAWSSPWLILAATATFVEFRNIGQPWAAAFALLLLSFVAVFPFILLGAREYPPDLRQVPTYWLHTGDQAGLVLVGVLFVAAGVGLHGRRRHAGPSATS
jgi:hypothetical protein